MRKKARLLCLALAVVLALLTGCGSQTPQAGSSLGPYELSQDQKELLELLGLSDRVGVIKFTGPEEATALSIDTYELQDGQWQATGGGQISWEEAGEPWEGLAAIQSREDYSIGLRVRTEGIASYTTDAAAPESDPQAGPCNFLTRRCLSFWGSPSPWRCSSTAGTAACAPTPSPILPTPPPLTGRAWRWSRRSPLLLPHRKEVFPMAYKACIFDLDGTLADTLRSIAGFGNDTLNAFGLPAIPVEEYKQLVGNGADVLMDRMLRTVGAQLPPEERKRFRQEYDRRYEAQPMRFVVPYPGLPELLGELKSRGLKLGVLSNKPDNMTRYIAGELYGAVLDGVHGQRAGVPKKPDPTALLALAGELGVEPGEVLYVGDSGVDMDTGRNAGMDPCGVLWGFRGREELLAHGASYLAADAAGLRAIVLGEG